VSSNLSSSLSYTLFGESHSVAIGITIEGLPAGFSFNFAKINDMLQLRRGAKAFNTKRTEDDDYQIISGYFNDQTTGAPFTVIFPNTDIKSSDYEKFVAHPRPGHADFVAKIKYKKANDPRGGGHFSGRMTAPLVFFGAMALQLIQADYPTFTIHSHINQLHHIKDTNYYERRAEAVAQAFDLADNTNLIDASVLMDTYENSEIRERYRRVVSSLEDDFSKLEPSFPLLDANKSRTMRSFIDKTLKQGSTLGGQIETIVFHPPVALGEPFFLSVESLIASLLFSVGSVKAVSFGYGDAFITSTGSDIKDEIIQIAHNTIATLYNYNGGINGGITNGEDIVIATTFKPISSIQQVQHTFNTTTKKIEPLTVNGRHDVTIVNRIIPVIEAMILIALYDLLLIQKSKT